MEKIIKFKISILCTIISLTATIFLSSASGHADLSSPSKVRYAPNQITVKFKKKVANLLAREMTKKGKVAIVTLSPSLDRINKKYKVKSFEPVFKNFKKNKNRLYTIRLKGKLKAKYNLESVDISAKEAHLLKRLQRAPKNAKLPDLDRIYKLKLEEGQSVEQAVAEYSQDPNVEYAQLNYLVQICSTPLPNLPYVPDDHHVKDGLDWREGSWGQAYPDMWGLKKIQAIEAWNMFDTNENGTFDIGETGPGEGVIVAVIDTGVDYNHPDLADNIWINMDEIPDNGVDDDGNGYIDDIRGWDIVGPSYSNEAPDNDPMDDNGHGTHCAGTVAAVGNNNIGVIGVAPQAKIMALKAFDSQGLNYDVDVAECVRYAADNGADILSNSHGYLGPGGLFSYVFRDAFTYAYHSGCVSIGGAGNDNADVADFRPANFGSVIAVSAFDSNDQKASFSNYGDKIDVAAPGVDILSTYPPNIAPPRNYAIAIVNTDNNRRLPAIMFRYSPDIPTGGLNEQNLYANLGNPEDFIDQDFTGKIALIERGGGLTFRQKVVNAQDAGAVGVIIYNNVPGNVAGTLVTPTDIPAMSISQEDGQYLKSEIELRTTIVTMLPQELGDDYVVWQGTSMACPHVAGVAALILSYHPEFSFTQVRQVLRDSADDVGEPGFDIYSGYGRINAYKALSPLVDFTASPLSGDCLLSVTFTDQSRGAVTDYTWDFGDGTISLEENPVHLYITPGQYDVTLTVTGPGGSDTTTKAGYITVESDIRIVPGSSIQDAIESSSDGYVIFIENGTYIEDISISGKHDIQLIGESASDTVLKGNIVSKNASLTIRRVNLYYNDCGYIDYADGQYPHFNLLNDASITAINSEITVKDCIIMPDSSIFGENKFGKGIQLWNMFESTDKSPTIENNLILNAKVGINLFSQAFGGAIGGLIKNNTFVTNNYGILLRMHKENPLIQDNIITDSSNSGIHITYEDGSLLDDRIVNILGNDFFSNNHNVWCDETQEELAPLPDGVTEQQGNLYENPQFDSNYIPQNPACEGKGYSLP